MLYGLLDRLYAYSFYKSSQAKLGLFFSNGWGDETAISAVQKQFALNHPPADINISWQDQWHSKEGYACRNGTFQTPYYHHFLPEESKTAYFRLIMPTKVNNPPVCLHMATSGEQGYKAREASLVIPLAKQGIGSLMLEHPFLGKRRPASQLSSRLTHVSDLLLLGGAAVEEARALLYWLHNNGISQLAITGISKGGHLAELAAAMIPFRIAVIPCVAPHSAVPIYTEGLIRTLCDWQALSSYLKDSTHALSKLTEVLNFTDVQTLNAPLHSPTILVAATDDKFVPKHSTEKMIRHWKHAEPRWIKGGHVSSILWKKKIFLKAIVDAVKKIQGGK